MLSQMLCNTGIKRFLPVIVHSTRILYTDNFIPSTGSSYGTHLVSSQDVKNQVTEHVSIGDMDPERDLVNFPRPVRKEYPDKVRFGIVPEEWFEFLYPRTGVLGPFVFGTGLVTFLVSKEIYVLDHEFYSGISVGIMSYLTVTRVGPHLASYLDREVDEMEDMWNAEREEPLKMYEEAIKMEKKEQWRAEGEKMLFDAKKELVAIQLETEYRERIMEAYDKVKRRLDYELERNKVVQFVAHKTIAGWVVRRVLESITPALESVALRRCVTELAALGSYIRPFPVLWRPPPLSIWSPHQLPTIPRIIEQLLHNETLHIIKLHLKNPLLVIVFDDISSMKHQKTMMVFFPLRFSISQN